MTVYRAARTAGKTAAAVIKHFEQETKRTAVLLPGPSGFAQRAQGVPRAGSGSIRQFGTNVIGHFLLTQLLLAPDDGVDFASLTGGPERDVWLKTTRSASWKLYGESKMGNLFISNHVATKYAGVLVSWAVHLGGLKSFYAPPRGTQSAQPDAVCGSCWAPCIRAVARDPTCTLRPICPVRSAVAVVLKPSSPPPPVHADAA
ncbi:hypothetical protein B0H15DRAFT_944456 [Mycena belliarum]|uniref:Uncharacterized protein n=1 Tax=Mycena belliarum TaxID=1033014 RepID=A0AAD6UE23_9AGAR|nr:hypothetical protein B0H15DRAFT_944456 [Mycena belliae]